MKNICKFAVLGAVLAASSSFVFADTIGSFQTIGPNLGNINSAMTLTGFLANNFGSGPTFVDPGFTTPPSGNLAAIGDPTGATSTLNGVGTWNGPLPNSTYVGYAASNAPGGTNPPQGFYTYTTTFTLTGGAEAGLLSVYADDTAEVFLNGTLLANEIMGFGTLASDSHCASGTPNCITSGTVLLNASSGLNTLTFVVLQAGDEKSGDPSGIDFSATLAPTPEPSSLILLGTGLFGVAGLLFRRRKVVA